MTKSTQPKAIEASERSLIQYLEVKVVQLKQTVRLPTGQTGSTLDSIKIPGITMYEAPKGIQFTIPKSNYSGCVPYENILEYSYLE